MSVRRASTLFLGVLVAAPASAADVSFECPDPTDPATVEPWGDDAPASLRERADGVLEALLALIPADCSPVTAADLRAGGSFSCASVDGSTVEWTADVGEWTDPYTWETERVNWVEITASYTLTDGGLRSAELTWSEEDSYWSDGSRSYVAVSGRVFTLGWDGSLAGLPGEGGSVSGAWEEGSRGPPEVREVSASWRDGSCDWEVAASEDQDWYYWGELTTAEHTTRVERDPSGVCGSSGQWWLDGLSMGAVDGWTWEAVEDDADGDGARASEGDCDDSDPRVHPCADDLDEDGLDQDCDGVDGVRYDRDRDGFDDHEDCDDADGAVYPGATELCDGLDNDCNGAVDDAPDSDADGFGACDGDCDDGRAGVHPGAFDVGGDGVDQDCSGGDAPRRVWVLPVPGLLPTPAPQPWAPQAPAVPAPSGGCAHVPGVGLLPALGGLLALRRARARAARSAPPPGQPAPSLPFATPPGSAGPLAASGAIDAPHGSPLRGSPGEGAAPDADTSAAPSAAPARGPAPLTG